MALRLFASVYEVAEELAREFGRRFPLCGLPGRGRKINQAKVAKQLDLFGLKVRDTVGSCGFGLVKRALFLRRFQKKLLAMGYEASVVKKVVLSLVVSGRNPGGQDC